MMNLQKDRNRGEPFETDVGKEGEGTDMENAAALWLVLILPLQIVSSKKVNIVLFSPGLLAAVSVDDPSEEVSTTTTAH